TRASGVRRAIMPASAGQRTRDRKVATMRPDWLPPLGGLSVSRDRPGVGTALRSLGSQAYSRKGDVANRSSHAEPSPPSAPLLPVAPSDLRFGHPLHPDEIGGLPKRRSEERRGGQG